jgi:hypothetical protein
VPATRAASPTPPVAPSILRRVPCGLRTDQAGRAILLERLPGARLSTAKGSQDGGGREICRPCRLPHRITPPKAGQGPHRARPGVRLASARPARRSGFRSQCCYLRSRHLSRGLRRPERRGRRASALRLRRCRGRAASGRRALRLPRGRSRLPLMARESWTREPADGPIFSHITVARRPPSSNPRTRNRAATDAPVICRRSTGR